MKLTFATVGQDILQVLSVLALVAKTAEPIVDFTQPGVAQIYNISTDTALAAIGHFLGVALPTQAPPSLPSAGPVPVPLAAPAPAAAAVDQADGAASSPADSAAHLEMKPGPGLANVVPA